jgi:hypothetical protein
VRSGAGGKGELCHTAHLFPGVAGRKTSVRWRFIGQHSDRSRQAGRCRPCHRLRCHRAALRFAGSLFSVRAGRSPAGISLSATGRFPARW